MRRLVVGSMMTMDGVVQAPGGPDEDRDGGFAHGGWLVPSFDEVFLELQTEWTVQADAFLLGRRTYDIFAASWPTATDPDDRAAAVLNSRPKHVASRTARRLAWANSSLLEGDAAEAVARLKGQPGGEIQVHGSGTLVQTLLRHDLVDGLRIWTFPVTVGAGKRLFADDTPARAFRLVSSQTTPSGAVLNVYERAGRLRHGAVEVGEAPVVFDTE